MSGKASNRKGKQFERDVANTLRAIAHIWGARRALELGRHDDRGDISGVSGWCLEVKNHARVDLAGWNAEAESEAANAGADRFAVVHKRRGHSPKQAWVTMPMHVFCDVLKNGQTPLAEDKPDEAA